MISLLFLSIVTATIFCITISSAQSLLGASQNFHHLLSAVIFRCYRVLGETIWETKSCGLLSCISLCSLCLFSVHSVVKFRSAVIFRCYRVLGETIWGTKSCSLLSCISLCSLCLFSVHSVVKFRSAVIFRCYRVLGEIIWGTKSCSLLSCISLCSLCLFSVHSVVKFRDSQSPFDSISARITHQLLSERSEPKIGMRAQDLLKTQNPDGTWPDIKYKVESISTWEPVRHLENLRTLSLSYKFQSRKSARDSISKAIKKGIRSWIKISPRCPNWWYNDIAVPQTLGEIGVVCQTLAIPLPASLKDSLVQAMKQRSPQEFTGANKLDIATHYLYRACLTKNPALMDTAVEQCFYPIALTVEEGLQYDYSYQQHGHQLMIASYGLVFLSGEYKVASWLVNTKYALSNEKLKLLETYLIQTFLPVIRGRYIDFNVEGRRIARNNCLDKFGASDENYIGGLIENAKRVNPAHAKILDQAALRISQKQPPGFGIEPLHKHFWKSDYTIHLRKGYSFNVRAVSVRTKRTETGNKENLFGKFLPDGCTNSQRKGDEYLDIMPVWEWDKIPGITSCDYKEDQPTIVQWGEEGSTGFVGGVSDGVYGCSAYTLDYDKVEAKKSWFFFDNEIACLGAGIVSERMEPVATTLNQCLLRGEVIVSEQNRTTKADAEKLYKPEWIWHDSIAYCFLQPDQVVVSVKNQSGSWKKIHNNLSPDKVTKPVFKVWINHGINPQKGSYAYAVLPAVKKDQIKAAAKNMVIVSNTEDVQAVYQQELKILQAIFYKAGIVTYTGMKLSVDKPCAVLLKTKQTPECWVADPTQKEESILITIKLGKQKEVKKKCELPKGNFAGSSVKVF